MNTRRGYRRLKTDRRSHTEGLADGPVPNAFGQELRLSASGSPFAIAPSSRNHRRRRRIPWFPVLADGKHCGMTTGTQRSVFNSVTDANLGGANAPDTSHQPWSAKHLSKGVRRQAPEAWIRQNVSLSGGWVGNFSCGILRSAATQEAQATALAIRVGWSFSYGADLLASDT